MSDVVVDSSVIAKWMSCSSHWTQHMGAKGVTADGPLYNTTHTDFPHVMLLGDWT